MAAVRLTDTKVRALKPRSPGSRYEVQDAATPGLRIRVSPKGLKTWVYVYRQGRRLRRMTIGTYPGVSLTHARAKASQARVAREGGEDPATNAASARIAQRNAPTVKELAENYLERYACIHKRTKSAREDERLLRKEIFPTLGAMRAVDLRKRDVVALLERINARAPIVANRTLAVLRKVYNWALEVDFGDIEANPCDRIKAPTQEYSRDRWLTEDELRTLWIALDHDKPPGATTTSRTRWPSRPLRLGLRLSLLTGLRESDIVAARQSEFDLDNDIWSIPNSRGESGQGRTKTGYGLQVPLLPLSKQVVTELLVSCPINAFNETPHGLDDRVGGFRPVERPGIVVVGLEVIADGLLQRLSGAMCAAT